jgi:micrococcal nuclease
MGHYVEDTSEYDQVIAIADGDTFTILTKDFQQVKIRLYGIDCPEKKQGFGNVAKQRLSELIFGKSVKLKITGLDRYKRSIAFVYDESGTCINEELLKEGLAWHFLKYDNNPYWDDLEEQAREQKLGLWSMANPVAPWDWRKSKRDYSNR